MLSFGPSTIRGRLFLSSVLISAVAVALMYLYVVPRLESSLTNAAISGITSRGNGQIPELEEALVQDASPQQLSRVAERASRITGNRVTVLSVQPFEGPSPGPPSVQVIADSENEDALSTDSLEIATKAAADKSLASGVGVAATGRRAEVAIPVSDTNPFATTEREWVVVFSQQLQEIESTVSRIRGQTLIAAAVAVLLALITGYVTSIRIGRRLNQLANATREVADGNFATQVPVARDDELGEVARAFNEMQIRLADLERARRQFIANASHELRTPIFSLGGFIELLDEEDLDPETRAEFISSMREQVDRLTKLTADLLDLSKLDSGAIQFRPQPVDLNHLAGEMASEFGPRADRHNSHLEVRTPETPILAMVDPDRTRQIIRILLDNALAHTPPGTKVTVTTNSDGARSMLTVFDQGPGIPKHVQDRMFDRFYTADDTGGSGLGLSIARSLAMRMNGQLAYTASKGRTSFTIDLPRANPGLLHTRVPSEETVA